MSFEINDVVKLIEGANKLGGFTTSHEWLLGRELRVISQPNIESKIRVVGMHPRFNGREQAYVYPAWLEKVDDPKEWLAHHTRRETYAMKDQPEDRIIEDGDEINCGTESKPLWRSAGKYFVGKCAKDFKHNGVRAEEYVGITIDKSMFHADPKDGWKYFLTKDMAAYPNGTEVLQEYKERWQYLGLDGEPIQPSGVQLVHRCPVELTTAYKLWEPASPGEIRPTGLQYRKKHSDNPWKDSGVTGKPVEASDIISFEYRCPKESSDAVQS